MSKKIKDREGLSKKPKKPKAAKKPAVDQAALGEVFPEAEPERMVRKSPDGSRKGGRSLEVFPAGRKCVCCGAALVTYHADKLCWPCDKAIAEWMNFPMNRSEIERRMSRHTLKYVTEKLTGRKRISNALGGEVSSGSWARASGKNMSRKKEG